MSADDELISNLNQLYNIAYDLLLKEMIFPTKKMNEIVK